MEFNIMGLKVRIGGAGRPTESVTKVPELNAIEGGYGGAPGVVYYRTQVYDGAQNLGESGPVVQYMVDYYAMRARSKELYLTSDVAQAACGQFKRWVVGKGLVLKSEPQKELLADMGIEIDAEVLNKQLERLWKVQANSTVMDYSGKKTFNQLQDEAKQETLVGGDVLVILRVIKGVVKVQHVDGMHVRNPTNLTWNGIDWCLPETGNRVRWGVEINDRGEPVAYHVRKSMNGLNTERIAARDKWGMLRAYMVTRELEGIGAERGMPLLAVVTETVKKISRYTSAALAGEEDRAKMSWVITQKEYSDDENPFITNRVIASRGAKGTEGGAQRVQDDLPVSKEGKQLAEYVTATTNKTTVFLGKGMEVKAPFDGKGATNVEGFGMFNIKLVCAALGIPKDVAMNEYNSSFSSSRMSGKTWEKRFKDDRVVFGQGYIDPVYALQVFVWAMDGKVDMPGFVAAVLRGDRLLMEAYLFCRWVGDNFPDIDPKKTIAAVREALGPSFDHVPIGTLEWANEVMDAGESESNLRQVCEELEMALECGLQPIPPKGSTEGQAAAPDSELEDEEEEEDSEDESEGE